jgi:hypothetical protein
VDELSTSALLPALLVTSATDICFLEGGRPHTVAGLLVTLFVPLLALLLFLEEAPKMNIKMFLNESTIMPIYKTRDKTDGMSANGSVFVLKQNRELQAKTFL